MQGIGVSTPSAAAVAAATIGLDSDMHMPNGGMLAIGLKSKMLATGTPPIIVRFCGVTTNVDGAAPKVHIKGDPITTGLAMRRTVPLVSTPTLTTLTTFTALTTCAPRSVDGHG